MNERIDNIFYSLSDSNRRLILTMLTKRKMSVNSIAEHFSFSRPAVSKHLKVLQDSKLVIPEQKGRERFYRLNPAPLKEVYRWLEHYEKFWDKKLKSLKNLIENGKNFNR